MCLSSLLRQHVRTHASTRAYARTHALTNLFKTSLGSIQPRCAKTIRSHISTTAISRYSFITAASRSETGLSGLRVYCSNHYVTHATHRGNHNYTHTWACTSTVASRDMDLYKERPCERHNVGIPVQPRTVYVRPTNLCKTQ